MEITANQGTLFTVSAPSGAGKTSLVRALIETDDRLRVSVSHTTRVRRPGETDGVNYHFVDRAAFEALREQGGFFEWAEVFGNLYGTSRGEIDRLTGQGSDVILEIDWQGAQQVKAAMPQSCAIFVVPPSLDALRQRLDARGQDDETTIDRRMAEARSELAHCLEGDFLVLNADFDVALADLRAIVRSQRLSRARQRDALSPLLEDFLTP